MAPHNRTINRLCERPETRQTAHDLYSRANRLTGPTTGHNLGLGPDALSAICALLASERLGNCEVSEEQARAAVCVDTKPFATALATVRKLVSNSSTISATSRKLTYEYLVQQHAVREDARVPMMEVEVALNESGALKDAPIEPGSAVVRCAIFHWVCTKVLRQFVPDLPVFQAQFRLSSRRWNNVYEMLEEHCSHMVDKLAQHAKTAAAPRATRSQTRTPTKKIGSASPKHLMPSPDESFVKSTSPGVVLKMKRKAPTDPGLNKHESPSKRPRDGSYKPSALGQDVTTHTPKAKRGNAAASNTPAQNSVISVQDEDEDEAVSADTIVVRSNRPSQKLPHNAAWDAQRPTTTPQSKQPPIETPPATPSTKLSSLTGTPMTSTGMSDASSESPSRARASRFRTCTRVRSPSPAASGSSSSSEEEDEMPRRRRRNLRAPFLDPDAYSWKPCGRTAQMLERARKWEALMNNKHGDPWDEL